MIHLPGYYPINQVRRLVLQEEVERRTASDEGLAGVEAAANINFAELIAEIGQGKLIGANGQVFDVSLDFLGMFTDDLRQHCYIDLYTGITRALPPHAFYHHATPPYRRWWFLGGEQLHAMVKGAGITAGIVSLISISAIAYIGEVPNWGKESLGLSIAIALTIAGTILAWPRPTPPGYDRLFDMGAFEGLSVMLNAEATDKLLKRTAKTWDEAPAVPLAEEGKVSERIVAMFDQRSALRKHEFREILGGHLTARGFERAWQKAREARPALGKPGRRPK